MRSLMSWIPRLWANWITLFGSVLATIAGLALALFLALDLLTPGRNAYTSSFLILFLPMMLVVGLAVIPVGLWWDRRKRHAEKGAVQAAFETALQDKRARNGILLVALFSLANVLLLGFAGKSSIEYMDSPEFCGGACHKVMQPEWSAYQRSPHANVACVECHIGSGAGSYVSAKVNGIGQMFRLFTNTYHRPIPTPVEALRADTCTHCHSKKTIGDRLRLYPHYKDDKDNTPLWNALVLHVGGEDPKTGAYHGIHRHANPNLEIRYQVLDEKRQKIGKITVRENGKLLGEYLPPGAPQKALAERRMDCIDCHNRPTHIFDPSPADAIARAISTGRLDAKIPNLVQIASELLLRPDGRRADAEAFFRASLAESYRQRQLAITAEQIDGTARVLAEIYKLNVYPDLKLGWGTYRSNLSHAGDGGCFRCHDKEHAMKLADGTTRALSQDCDSCHERIAADEDPKNFDETMKLLLPKSE